jgi:hypothetical protein
MGRDIGRFTAVFTGKPRAKKPALLPSLDSNPTNENVTGGRGRANALDGEAKKFGWRYDGMGTGGPGLGRVKAAATIAVDAGLQLQFNLSPIVPIQHAEPPLMDVAVGSLNADEESISTSIPLEPEGERRILGDRKRREAGIEMVIDSAFARAG